MNRNAKGPTSHQNFIIDLKKFTSVTAVTVQGLRRQGSGTIERIQEYLNSLDLFRARSFKDQEEFIRWLDKQTDVLVREHHVKWGAARKALNLFLRACLYDKYLSVEFDLDRLEKWLEIPLDRVIAEQLRKNAGARSLPRWQGLGELTEEKNRRFQDFATQMAAKKELSRIHLDVGLWVHNRKP